MPIIADKQKSFLKGLSDFWSIYFKDTQEIETYLDGVQLTSGQLFLSFLETVLSTSLVNTPIFNKEYFRYITIREDQYRFKEGPSLLENTYNFELLNQIKKISTLINKVIFPTDILQNQVDYFINQNQLSFRKQPFNNNLSFPVRIVTIEDPAIFVDVAKYGWTEVEQGDSLLFRLTTGTFSEAIITGINDNVLSLESSNSNFETPVFKKDFETFILRTPHDSPRLGVEIDRYFNYAKVSEGIVHMPGATTFDFTTSSKWKGNWAVSTLYTQGDFVNSAGVTYICKFTHVSGLSIGPEFESIQDYLLYYEDPDDRSNNGLYVLQPLGIGTALALNRPSVFSALGSSPKINYIGKLNIQTGVYPVMYPENTFIVKGSLVINARRAHEHTLNGITYPALQSVIEDVDYTVNYETGKITLLTIWEQLITITASYDWRIMLQHNTYKYMGVYTPGSYSKGSFVLYNNELYCSTEDFNTTAPNVVTKWVKFKSPFQFKVSRAVKEMALWGTDVLLDEETLYNNFGYLLADKRESSEQYKLFLRGVSQLFLLGPTFEKFESALNVVAGFPIVREDGEILRDFKNGIDFTGTLGQFIDSAEGRNGTLTVAGSLFNSITANFFPTDIGAVIKVLVEGVVEEYVITAINSSTQAVVTPAITLDQLNVRWSYEHVNMNKKFRDTSGSYLFSEDDINALIWVENAANDRNEGFFEIISIENSTTVVVKSSYSLIDEQNVSWKISRAKNQKVITDKNVYEFPLNIPIRDHVKDPVNKNVYIFKALECLTNAFEIVDYLRDESWWHNIAINEEILQIPLNDTLARRQVSEPFIEHIVNPMDQAVVGDFGLSVSYDDRVETRIVREGPAMWYGGSKIVLNFPLGVELARTRDLNCYVKITSPANLEGYYKILSIDTSRTVLKLELFPPITAPIPPVAIEVKLPTIVHRHTVGFVMFDSFLKYHAIQVRVNPNNALGRDLLSEIINLIQQAKPSFKYIYLEPLTLFRDTAVLSEDLTIGIGLGLFNSIFMPQNQLIVGPPTNIQVNDAFRFETQINAIPAAPGTYPFAPVLPPGGRFYVVKAGFDSTVLVNGGTKRPVEGVDYTVDYTTCDVTILPTSSFLGVNNFNFVLAILRNRTLIDPLDPYETRICVNGTDPTIRKHIAQISSEMGLLDRSVQINIT